MQISSKTLGKSLAATVIVLIILSSGLLAGAKTIFSNGSQVPFESYTYWETANGYEAVHTKPMFEAPLVIDAHALGVNEYTALDDVSVSEDGYIFLLDSEQSRITILDESYRVKKELFSVDSLNFKGAKGIYAFGELLYIADTENGRVIIADRAGNLINTIILPKSTLIPDGFVFRPIKIAVDNNGYTYVLSDGSYYGSILYSPTGEFLSFFGANSVSVGISQFISNIWNSLTMTNEKKSGQISKLPYQNTDLYVDSNNFVYTVTGKTKDGELQNGVVRRLSPNGTNILPSEDIAFGEKMLVSSENPNFKIGSQNIAGLAVDKNSFFCVYDTTFSKIYLYDSECNMFAAMGSGMNTGKQQGTFQKISAIEFKDDDILVTDSMKKTLTVFKCTETGKLIKKLQRMTLDGEYSEAKEGWLSVNRQDRNNRFAYIGLAKAAYADGEYALAMAYSQTAFDRDTYSQAFQHVRKENLKNNFFVIFIVIVLIIGFVFIILFRKGKKDIPIKNLKLRLFITSVFHPALAFSEIKVKKQGSAMLAGISVILFYLSVSSQQMFGSFVFVSSNSGSFNSLLLLLRTVGAVLLFSVTNWGICTLMGGIGKLKEIFAVVSYSLIPMIIGNILYTAVTHFLVPSEAAFMSVIMTVLQLYSVVMIIIGIIVIHDFSFGRFVATTLLTLFGMAVVLLVGVLLIILFQQFVAFLSTVFNEVIYK